MADLARHFAAMARQMEEMSRRQRGRSREGQVVEVDEANGLFRVDVGREGSPFLTPWIPAEAASSGELSIQADPVVGQFVRVISENGDLTDAVVGLSSYSGDAARPGESGGVFRIKVGDASIIASGSEILLSVGGASLRLTSSGAAFVGSGLTHGGTNVGRTHTHPHGDPAGNTGSPN